ncbi:CENP-B protein, partial [Tricholoma matsutake]
RLGHSTKGYTDGEIGVEWIKQFDKQTHAKAAGHQRLLLVDGHNSHYNRAFLKYARKNQIVVLSYPSHSTHIYQGLDVVIFSILKRWWTEARDKYEQQQGHKVDKTNFLSIYAKAHLQALSKENIIAAFRKTGIVPLNRNVI